MATQTYEVAVAMVVEVSRVRVEIDTDDVSETLEELLKQAAGVAIDVRAGGEYGSESFVSHQYVDGVIGWNQVD